eukprot:INCI2797.1.p2 GENE.INCI2797.1~~INCI2797.1.p2  ORF type:complete len:929 (+),score=166.08 INCI2797.1:288-3074(+)
MSAAHPAAVNLEWLSNGAALVQRRSGEIAECNATFRKMFPLAGTGGNLWAALDVDPFEGKSVEIRQRIFAGSPRGQRAGAKARFADADADGDDDNDEAAAAPAQKSPLQETGSGADTAAQQEEEHIEGAPQRFYTVSAKVVGDGEMLFVEASDCTRLRVAQSQSKAFLEMSFDGYFDWHINEDYEYMSPRFWEIFGYKPEEKEHKPSAWQDMIFKEDLADVMKRFDRHVASRGKVPYVQDARYRHKNGSTVVVTCQGRVIEWDEKTGAPLRMIGTHTDVTHVRQKARAETERQVNDYLAHEVRNPLTSAVAATRFLRTSLQHASWNDPAMRGQVVHDTQVLHDNLMAISSLIGRLVELHKIYGNNVGFSLSPACLFTDVLKPVQATMQDPEAAHSAFVGSQRLPSNLGIELVCADPDFKANIDVLRVKQVVCRVVGHLACRLESGRVRVTLNPPSEEGDRDFAIEVEVFGNALVQEELAGNGDSDLMLGISSDGVRQSAPQGAGPGLHVARTLTDAMGGSLTVQRRDGANETHSAGPRLADYITLKLPGALAATSPSGTDEHCASKLKVDKFYHDSRVLVIDDEPTIRKLVPRRLKALIPGVIVDCAASGEAALDLARQHHYSLYLVDHFMPGPNFPLTGAETICQLRLMGVQAPIVGCSGNDVSVLHAEAGADSFILKPTPPNAKFIQILNSVVPRIPPKPINVLNNAVGRMAQRTMTANKGPNSDSIPVSGSHGVDVAHGSPEKPGVASSGPTASWINSGSSIGASAGAPSKSTPSWISNGTDGGASAGTSSELPSWVNGSDCSGPDSASGSTPSWISNAPGTTSVAGSTPSWISNQGATEAQGASSATPSWISSNDSRAEVPKTPSWIKAGNAEATSSRKPALIDDGRTPDVTSTGLTRTIGSSSAVPAAGNSTSARMQSDRPGE